MQNPTISLAGDVAATKLIIDSQPGPVILVGHSYDGVVITEAGTDPNVAGLVYITAFAPDKGESVNTLIANAPPGTPVPPLLPLKDGYLFLDKVKFPDAFAGDVDLKTAIFMADSQVPWGVNALGGAVTLIFYSWGIPAQRKALISFEARGSERENVVPRVSRSLLILFAS